MPELGRQGEVLQGLVTSGWRRWFLGISSPPILPPVGIVRSTVRHGLSKS
jgi:hypothetical protein